MSTTGYSEDSQGESEGSQEPLMIEAMTSEPERTQAPSSAVDGLTITEAAAAYGISVSTLRRRLKAGEIVGAAKVTGPKGQEYRSWVHRARESSRCHREGCKGNS